jgi:hypothetical protein
MARNMDKPASARSAADAVHDRDAHHIQQHPALVVQAAFFGHRIMPADGSDLRSWRPMDVISHALLADAEG